MQDCQVTKIRFLKFQQLMATRKSCHSSKYLPTVRLLFIHQFINQSTQITTYQPNTHDLKPVIYNGESIKRALFSKKHIYLSREYLKITRWKPDWRGKEIRVIIKNTSLEELTQFSKTRYSSLHKYLLLTLFVYEVSTKHMWMTYNRGKRSDQFKVTVKFF